MRLNNDLIRDILLTVETNDNLFFNASSILKMELLQSYDIADVKYHLNQCNERGLFSAYVRYVDGGVRIETLSPAGHSFIAKIRDDTAWAKIKKIAVKAGKVTLTEIIKLAVDVASGNI